MNLKSQPTRTIKPQPQNCQTLPWVLVTGVAGFIGHHTAIRLLELSYNVVGVDLLHDPNAPTERGDPCPLLERLQRDRLRRVRLSASANRDGGCQSVFKYAAVDVSDFDELHATFAKYRPDFVVHLAARAGVRASIENPHEFVRSNVVGFMNMLDLCKQFRVQHLAYASSSSVYGNHSGFMQESMRVDRPISPYAATKAADELFAHSYAACHRLSSTGMRFFTVYGPYGRPDMALWIFATAIMHKRPIPLFNNGDMMRDFTYVDDVVTSIVKVLRTGSRVDALPVPHRVLNVGGGRPKPIIEYVKALELAFGTSATLEKLPFQNGDVESTACDTACMEQQLGYVPTTDIVTGVGIFVKWFKAFMADAESSNSGVTRGNIGAQ